MKKIQVYYYNKLSQELRQKLEERDFTDLDIEDVWTDTQLSKFELQQDYVYVAIELPQFNKKTRHFLTKEIHFFITHSELIVINKDKYQDLEDLFEAIETFGGFDQELSFQKEYEKSSKKGINGLRVETIFKNKENRTPIGFFYEIFDHLITQKFFAIGKFRSEIRDIEEDTFRFEASHKDNQSLIKEIVSVKRNLANFKSILIPVRDIVLALENPDQREIITQNGFINNEGFLKLDDSLDKLKKLLSTIDNFREQMELITQTNEIIASRTTNETVKRLTFINLIFLIPNIITSFFGMNVFFGWKEDHAWPAWSILSFIIGVTITILIIFRSKKWV